MVGWAAVNGVGLAEGSPRVGTQTRTQVATRPRVVAASVKSLPEDFRLTMAMASANAEGFVSMYELLMVCGVQFDGGFPTK